MSARFTRSASMTDARSSPSSFSRDRLSSTASPGGRWTPRPYSTFAFRLPTLWTPLTRRANYVRCDTLYHRNLPSFCGDGRPVYGLRTRMGRLLSAAPLDQRGASPRLASHLPTLAAHFRVWPPASDPQRRLFRFLHRKVERRLAPRVAAGHRVRVRDRIRVHLAARAHAACCSARGEYPAFGSWACVCPRSRDPHTDPNAASARAWRPLCNDYQARPRHRAVHLARRHRGGPDLRRNGVDGTPFVASLTRIRHPAVFSSDARTAFWQLSKSRMLSPMV